ncbi:MAG: TRAP-type mannitol/chloroaromatic compound transport system permease small subunit [Paracoccaceae bacterium]
MILVAIASVACAARSPLIWSIEVAQPLFAQPLFAPPLFLWPLLLWPLFLWLSVFVADLALQKNRHFGLQIVMEMLDARGQVWLRRFNLMVLAVVLAFFLIHAWRNMIEMHPRLYGATQMRGSWHHASM